MMISCCLGVTVDGRRLILAWTGRGLFSMQVGGLREAELPEEEEQVEEFVELEVRDFLAAEGVKPDRVVVSMPRETAVMRLVELPEAVMSNLDEAVSYEAEKHFPLPASQTLRTHWVVGKPEEGKVRLWLVSVRRNQLERVLAGLQSAKVGIDVVELSPLSLWRLASREIDKAGKVAVVDVRDEVAEVDMFEGGELVYSRAAASRADGEVIRQLVEGAREHLGGSWVEGRPDAIVVCGGLEFSAEEREGFDCESFVVVGESKGVAHGAAMRDMPVEPVAEKNLLPPEMRSRRLELGVPVAVALLILTLGLFLGGYAGKVHGKALRLENLDQRISELEPEYEGAKKLRMRVDKILEGLERFREVRSEHTDRAIDVLYELTSLFPYGVRFDTFNLTDDLIQLRGYEPLDMDIMPELERSEMFRNVTPVGSLKQTANETQFDNIQMRLER